MHRRFVYTALVLVLVLGALSPLAAQRSTGLVFAEEDRYRSIPLASPPLMGEVPSSADLRRYFPSPGDQGEQSSCVGWAAAYGVKTYQEGVERGWNIEDDDHQFSPAYVYNQIAYPPGNRMGGASYIDAFNVLTEQGALPLSEFGYNQWDCSTMPTHNERSRANPYRIATWRRVNVMDTVEMKAQISSGFPVMLGIMVDNGLEYLGPGEVYSSYSGYSTGGHAVVAIGYDDARGAFKIFNSWGTGWGDNGCGWISYEAMKQIVVEGYVCQDLIISVPDDVSYVDGPDEVEYDPYDGGKGPYQVEDSPEADPADYYVDSYDPDIYAPADYPYAVVDTTWVEYDVETPDGFGMIVYLDGELSNCYGGVGQVLLQFTFANGQPLYANSQYYADIYGQVAVYTEQFVVEGNDIYFEDLALYIPYWALNMAPGFHNLAVTPIVYVNNYNVGTGEPLYFDLTQY
jgi:hypothetical protein